MNDLYFTAKNKKACKDVNHPGKACKFNEILLCRMKSKRVWMKSSVCHLRRNQIRPSSPRVSGISSRNDFIHEVDLFRRRRIQLKKTAILYQNHSLFLVGEAGYSYGIYPRPAPEERALQSSDGVCEPARMRSKRLFRIASDPHTIKKHRHKVGVFLCE